MLPWRWKMILLVSHKKHSFIRFTFSSTTTSGIFMYNKGYMIFWIPLVALRWLLNVIMNLSSEWPALINIFISKVFSWNVYENFFFSFSKFYWKLCVHFSILFADICGFTTLSDQCTAEELVRLLNELFARYNSIVILSHFFQRLSVPICQFVFTSKEGGKSPI